MNSPSIHYAPRPDSSFASELGALANVYRLALDSAKKKGRLPDECGPDDGTKTKGDSANEHRST